MGLMKKKREMTLEKAVCTVHDLIVAHNIAIFNLLEELKLLILSSETLSMAHKIYFIDELAKN